jgi:hypothetical protein
VAQAQQVLLALLVQQALKVLRVLRVQLVVMVVMVRLELKVIKVKRVKLVAQALLVHKVLKVQQGHKDLQVVLVLVLQWKVKLLRQVTYHPQATQKVMLI